MKHLSDDLMLFGKGRRQELTAFHLILTSTTSASRHVTSLSPFVNCYGNAG